MLSSLPDKPKHRAATTNPDNRRHAPARGGAPPDCVQGCVQGQTDRWGLREGVSGEGHDAPPPDNNPREEGRGEGARGRAHRPADRHAPVRHRRKAPSSPSGVVVGVVDGCATIQLQNQLIVDCQQESPRQPVAST